MIVGISIPDEIQISDQDWAKIFQAQLQLLAMANAAYFRTHPDAPCCLDCGAVRYIEPGFSDRITFPSAPDLLRAGATGCAGAAAYVAGKALAAGEMARVEVLEIGPGDYHAIVIHADGRREDPTLEMPR